MAGANDKGLAVSVGSRVAYGGLSGPVYDDTDADAGMVKWDMEPGSATDVPVVLFGIDILGVDLGLFDGRTEPVVGVVDLDGDSAVTLGFSADDVATIVLGGSAVFQLPDLTFIGDTANANMAVGLTINQGANDDQILALKSSDITNGHTGTAEADTYTAAKKRNAIAGGLDLQTFTSSNVATAVSGHIDAADSDDTDTTASSAVNEMHAWEDDGANGRQAVTAGNIFGVFNANVARMLVKEDGEVHVGNTTLVTLADDLPDAVAARDLRLVANGTHQYPTAFAEELERRGVVRLNRDSDGVPFWNLLAMDFLSWDMGFQNFSFIAEIANVLTDEQKHALSPSFKAALSALPQGV